MNKRYFKNLIRNNFIKRPRRSRKKKNSDLKFEDYFFRQSGLYGTLKDAIQTFYDKKKNYTEALSSAHIYSSSLDSQDYIRA